MKRTCIIIALLATFAMVSIWAPAAEGARTHIKSQPFAATVKVTPFKASQGVPGSQYIFSQVTPVYRIENRFDDMRITVGLIGLPDAKRPRWYVSIGSESGVGDLVCRKGEKIWPSGLGEFDDETYLGGCMGTGLAARFNKSAKVRVVPFTLRDSDDGWRIYLNGRQVATLTNPEVDHAKDRLLHHSRARNAYGCIPLSERYPSTYCGN
jgi:hypothetical protein